MTHNKASGLRGVRVSGEIKTLRNSGLRGNTVSGGIKTLRDSGLRNNTVSDEKNIFSEQKVGERIRFVKKITRHCSGRAAEPAAGRLGKPARR
ncbi:hypothetical protein [Desulfonema magnum]|nr:hypothetical protein [Desulfonema magnum]